MFKYPVLRTGVDILGGLPTFRIKDVVSKVSDEPIDDEAVAMQRAASQRLQEVSVHKIVAGQNMAIFPEGTRNKENPRQVQALKIGLGNIACQAAEAVDVAILPIGIYYGEAGQMNYRHPSVMVGRPMDVSMLIDPKQVVNEFAPRLQSCVDMAVEARQSGL